MEQAIANDLTGILAITLIFGGGALIWIVSVVAENWRKARVAEQNAVLKKSMIERGFSADEIVKVLTAEARARMAGKKAEPVETE